MTVTAIPASDCSINLDNNSSEITEIDFNSTYRKKITVTAPLKEINDIEPYAEDREFKKDTNYGIDDFIVKGAKLLALEIEPNEEEQIFTVPQNYYGHSTITVKEAPLSSIKIAPNTTQ